MEFIRKHNTMIVLFILAVLITALVISVGVSKADADDTDPGYWPTEPLPDPVDGVPDPVIIEQGYPEEDEGEIGEGIVEYAPADDSPALPSTGY